MTLQEWNSLTPKERKELAHYWCNELKEPIRLADLCGQAARMLALEISSRPEVAFVRNGGMVDSFECIINVSTTLGEGEILPGLPEEYASFKVVQRGMADSKRRFERCCAEAFTRLGVGETKTKVFLGRLELLDLGMFSGISYYEGPLSFVAGNLVMERDRELDGLPLVHLNHEVRDALREVNGQQVDYPNEDPDYDWKAAQERVKQAFKRSGYEWP
jgi:hypothetical protein